MTDKTPCSATAALDRYHREQDLHDEAMRLCGVDARDEVLVWLRDTYEGRQLLWDYLADELYDMWFTRRFQEVHAQCAATEVGGMFEDAVDKAERNAMECKLCREKVRERAMEMYYEENE